MHLFMRALTAVSSLLSTMAVIMAAFALACRDAFGGIDCDHGAACEDGIPLFPTFSMSVATMVRLFIGEGWHGVMFATVVDIRNGDPSLGGEYKNLALILFPIYILLVTMLFGQLLVGVTITLYQEAMQLQSPRVYKLLTHVFRNYSEAERKALETSLMSINSVLMKLNGAVQARTEAKPNLHDFHPIPCMSKDMQEGDQVCLGAHIEAWHGGLEPGKVAVVAELSPPHDSKLGAAHSEDAASRINEARLIRLANRNTPEESLGWFSLHDLAVPTELSSSLKCMEVGPDGKPVKGHLFVSGIRRFPDLSFGAAMPSSIAGLVPST